MSNPNKDSVDLAKDEALRQRKGGQAKQMILWFAALIVGAILGWMQVPALNELFNFVATVFTRLFQFIAVPTIALAVITTLSALGAKKDTGRIFAHAVTYTLLTTIAAASIGLVLYLWIAPGNLPADLIGAGASDVPMQKLGSLSYYDHFLSVIPNNMLQPFLAGNVLSVMLIAAAVGLALAFMPKTENRAVLLTPDGRRKVQKEWQTRKQQKITHPFLKEKMEWGLLPHVQALLLARCLREDLEGYPPFLWK